MRTRQPYDGKRVQRQLPRPHVRLTVIDKLLRRHVTLPCPEAHLAVAVITLAIGDCLDPGAVLRAEARHFLAGSALEFWCDAVGLEATFVRAIARKGGYLPSETAHGAGVKRTPKERGLA
ncbi:hypothetical protein [Methylococcus capsulatus]|jgi:hypothetical protein|uniref:Uncharacterized protein n=1 Tax=Methylococcus capsulatus TaxID=414 RepID=A0AA35UC31_METCP|nr:hypothetical protein [Methylococcus capsulatus]QXP89579.1 hypothetical protein KW114_10745 [Methylococcus capsulatus]CAI8819965.1 protein of unknown function [Methylococcus capsulatus]